MISAAAITLVIQLVDLSGVPPPIVHDAKAAVEEILVDIDVTVEWTPASDAVRAQPNAIRVTMLSYEGGALRARDGAVMGAAARTPLGTGVAWVYYQRVL